MRNRRIVLAALGMALAAAAAPATADHPAKRCGAGVHNPAQPVHAATGDQLPQDLPDVGFGAGFGHVQVGVACR